MDRKTVDAMTTDEVRVAVAKARGWSNIRTVNSYGDCVGVDPSGQPLMPIPYYYNPIEYMALMDEIWEVKKDACIVLGGVGWNFRDGGFCDGVTNQLWEAIARAWLIICAE